MVDEGPLLPHALGEADVGDYMDYVRTFPVLRRRERKALAKPTVPRLPDLVLLTGAQRDAWWEQRALYAVEYENWRRGYPVALPWVA